MAKHNADQLRERFSYDPETGDLIWRVHNGRRSMVGHKAGSLASNGRIYVHLEGHIYMAHRLVWCLVNGRWPEQNLSALNGDYTDLRLSNYAEISHGKTAQKGGVKRAAGKSGVPGVAWDESRKKWIVMITRNYKSHNVGRFDTIEEALAARERAIERLDGEPVDLTERQRQYSRMRRRHQLRLLFNKSLAAAGGVSDWKSFDEFASLLEPKEDRHAYLIPADPDKPFGPSNWKWARREVIDWKDKRQKLEAGRRHRARNRAAYKDKELRKAFGITIADYQAMLVEQNGVCAICDRPETTVRRGRIEPLSVDHCHTTGKVRGLLCAQCNKGLGMFHDKPERIERAVHYLKRHAPTEDRSNVIQLKRKD